MWELTNFRFSYQSPLCNIYTAQPKITNRTVYMLECESCILTNGVYLKITIWNAKLKVNGAWACNVPDCYCPIGHKSYHVMINQWSVEKVTFVSSTYLVIINQLHSHSMIGHLVNICISLLKASHAHPFDCSVSHTHPSSIGCMLDAGMLCCLAWYR